MKGKERAALRKQANTLAPIFQIGKGDIGDAMIEAIDAAFSSATRDTFVGSMIPAFSRSSYLSSRAL